MNSKKIFWALTKEKDFRPEHARIYSNKRYGPN